MQGIKVKIIEYVDDSNPGWVRCTFVDAYRIEWTIIEKVPIVTQEDLNERSQYPRFGFVAGEIKKVVQDVNKREIITIDTSKPWAIEAINGETIFDVHSDQIIGSFP